jgi:hypothetical protein
MWPTEIFGMSTIDTRESICVKNIVMLCIDVPLHCLLQNQIKINKYLVILIVFPWKVFFETLETQHWQHYKAKGAQ